MVLDKYYKIATNDYVFNGGDGYLQFKNAKDVVKTGVYIQPLIFNYIKDNSPISIKLKIRLYFYIDQRILQKGVSVS